MTNLVLLAGVLLLAWSNGANDNLKGVATLRGSGVLSARQAVWLASAATAAGGLVSIALAGTLARAFRGAGIVPDDLLADPAHLAAIGCAAALTILAATRLGMPTSTTHALLGALVGAALVLAPGRIDGSVLSTRFARPLLASPLLAISLTLPPAWHVLRSARRGRPRMRPEQACVCVAEAAPAVVAPGLIASSSLAPTLIAGGASECARRPDVVASIAIPRFSVALHVLSGAAVCFARALNDTPKIAALLLGGELLGASLPFLAVATAMVLGGLLQSERVAHTLSEKITTMTPTQGVLANLATAVLVLSASALALPVSTTHVSCGALFGIGIASGEARWGVIARILLAWVTTLPAALVLSAAFVHVARTLA